MNAGIRGVGAAMQAAWGVLCIASLAGCSGNGSVNTGSNQNPDPASPDFPMFYVKRALPTNTDNLHQMRDVVPDADLYMRDRASASAPETNITGRVTGSDLYDVKDVNVSYDGKKVVFAMRGPLTENMDEESPPFWALWEYDIATDTLHRLIESDITAGAGNDVAPAYLPDGRIVFSSTRQARSKAILLDENKPQFEAQNEERSESAFVLHVMDADGGNIHQISFNQSHDRSPTVLMNGRVLFSRWDRAPGHNAIHLYTVNPDGTDLQLHYGANSHDTGTDDQFVEFVGARETQDGRILSVIREDANVDFGGDLVIIDANTYVENTQPTLANAGMSGPAQMRATANDVHTIPGPSPGGRFHSAFPLWDGSGRILVSWSSCRLLDSTGRIVPCSAEALADPNAQAAAPLYGVWMFDPIQDALLPVIAPFEGVMITDVVVAQPRPLPAVILDKVPGLDFDDILREEGVGVLDIRSVYDFDGVDTANPNIATLRNPAQTTANQRPARFIRLEKAVSIPDDDVLNLDDAAFGATGYMREIMGYAPVEPDGSVRIKVPADVAFQINILDRNGRRSPLFPAHSNWLQVRAGEVLACNGCHTPAAEQNTQSPQSHGRSGLFASAYSGAAATGQPFPNTRASLSPEAGETMAQTRARLSCLNDTPRCEAMLAAVGGDLRYEDVWTDPNVRAPFPSFSFTYANLTTPSPASIACTNAKHLWTSACRIVINYEDHIQPLWDKVRSEISTQTSGTADSCTSAGCHNPQNAAAMPQAPAGQLDLTAVPSDEEPLQLRSYRELLFPDIRQDNMGVDQCAPTDPLPIGCAAGPYVDAGSANGSLSRAFLNRFAAGSASDHAGFLSPDELRLLSEWLDIGAQYFNNPFDGPVN